MAKKKKKNKGTLLLLGILLVVAVGFIGFKVLLSNASQAFQPENSSKIVVTIPMGSGVSQIADILEENKIIESSNVFKLVSKITRNDGNYKAGSYALSPSMDVQNIIKVLQSGISVGNLVTIPEGYTIGEVADLLQGKGLINKDVFLQEVENGSFPQKFVADLPAGSNRLEGFLYPETYDIPIDADEHEIINILLNHFDKLYEEDFYTKANEMGYSLHEIITIASMIEREAGSDSDRPLVASVIYNRLAITMPLQLDATVQYALGSQKDRLMESDTRVESEYNTYLHNGLPPGPICSPGIESIKAALYPEETDYLYYVVDPTGNKTHKFAETYEEFLVYKREYIDSL